MFGIALVMEVVLDASDVLGFAAELLPSSWP